MKKSIILSVVLIGAVSLGLSTVSFSEKYMKQGEQSYKSLKKDLKKEYKAHKDHHKGDKAASPPPAAAAPPPAAA
ncbi:MAG: hypothetical protein QNK11_03020, partial [Legionella sp.]|nr:hypothetical protein [Legionella sp.]